jgi:hypothetical protein
VSSARPAHRRTAAPVAGWPGAVRWLVPLVALLGSLVVLAPAPPAMAQSIGPAPDPDGPNQPAGSAATGDVRLTVTAFTGVLGPGTVDPDPDNDRDPRDLPPPPDDLELRVVVENLGAEPLDALRLVVEVHPAAGSRSQLRAALDGELQTEPLHVHDPAITADDPLPPGGAIGVADVFEGDMVAWREDVGGVHPVRIAVVRGTSVLAEAVSAVVWLGELPVNPLLFSLVYPLDEAPWRTVGGAYLGTADRSIEVGGRLDRLLRALERHPEAPVALAPAAHLVEDLSDRASGFTSLQREEAGSLESRAADPGGPSASRSATTLDRLRTVAATLPFDPVGGPYAGADLSALTLGPAPLPELAAEAAADGRRRLQRTLGRSVDASTTLTFDPLDPAVLDLLPGEVVVLPYEATTDPPAELGLDLQPSVRVLRSPAGRRSTAVVADPYLSAHLSEPDLTAGPLLAAHRILAESAMAFFEAPGTPDRTVVALPPARWDVEPRFLEHVLAGLDAAPWLRARPLSQLALLGVPGDEPVELRPIEEARFPSAFETTLGAAARDLEAARAALPDDATSIGGRTPMDLRDQLLRAASTWWRRTGTSEAAALVGDVQRATDTTFGAVDVAASSVTLTSDTGQVPVTLHRRRGGPILIQVEVASQGRLLFPDGRRSETLLLEEEGTQTVSFTARALSTGTFPVTVRVTDPTGTRELERMVLSVRSTSISGPALAGTGLVVLVLLLLGAVRRRRRPPPPSPSLTVVPDAATDAAGREPTSTRSEPATSPSAPRSHRPPDSGPPG